MFQDNLDVASRENPDVLDALLQPEQDNLDSTRILKAVKYNRVDSMRSLLGAGVEPSATEEFGHTIIQYAIIHNTLESLLKALNISTKDCNKSPTYKIVDERASLYSKDGYESDFSEIESNCTVRVNLKKYIMQTNKEGRNAFHTASSMGDLNILKLLYSTCDGDVDLDVMDKAGHTPLSMAIRGGYSNCVKFLIKNGSDLSMRFKSGVSAIQLLLKECPKGYEIMDKVLDFCAKEDGKIDFSMLFSDKAETQLDIVFLMFRYARRDQWGILSHPIVECLIALKWALVAPLFWMRFIAYIVFTGFLTSYTVARTMEADKPVTGMLRIPICFFASLVVALSMFFVSSTPKHLIHRTGVSILRLLPPVLAIVYVLLDDGESKWPQQIGSFAILCCWLGLLMNLDIYPTLSHQAYMFLEICYGMFKNPWRAFLYTNMVLLQGGFSNVRLFDTEMHMDVTDSIVIGILALLFLLVTIIGVLNMLVGLAVRGSQELEIDGHIIYQKHKVETLYGLEKKNHPQFTRVRFEPNLPVLGSLPQHEAIALASYATKAGLRMNISAYSWWSMVEYYSLPGQIPNSRSTGPPPYFCPNRSTNWGMVVPYLPPLLSSHLLF
uniref:Ion transport domain-containing protein n=1 Tax=Timema genevievae TaxID=629358 RepID=A0A7R9K4L9_TIMGE|nr:unnamed protein product [Timema genevievae]